MDDTCFDAAAPLLAFGAALLTAAARVATGVVFLVLVPLALVFDTGLAAAGIALPTLLFTVVLAGLATAFVVADAVFEAGLSVFAMVLASLPATVFRIDFLAGAAAVLLFGAAAVFAAVFLTLLAAALLVADLVTVAFMIPSLNELHDLFDLARKRLHLLFSGRSGFHRAYCPRILPNDYLRCMNQHQILNSLYQTLFQTANKSFFREILADKDHFAAARLAVGPFGADIGAHHLVHALENHLAVGAVHP